MTAEIIHLDQFRAAVQERIAVFDHVLDGGEARMVWDVTPQNQPIVLRDGRKIALSIGNWVKLSDAVKRAVEMVK